MNPFLGPWKIIDWNMTEEVLEGIPANGFKVPGPLTITGRDPDGSSIDLFWRNEDDQDCSATDLQYREASNRLEGQNISTTFAGLSVLCDITVDLDLNDSTTLKLTINFAGGPSPSSSQAQVLPDVGGGVVTATANPSGNNAQRR